MQDLNSSQRAQKTDDGSGPTGRGAQPSFEADFWEDDEDAGVAVRRQDGRCLCSVLCCAALYCYVICCYVLCSHRMACACCAAAPCLCAVLCRAVWC